VYFFLECLVYKCLVHPKKKRKKEKKKGKFQN
jgi:hypothetical protein